ncbi:hypothetical protein GCM10011415_21700 [Salipiger pallidus]|uniref:Uncharacterized protein n=1 Tax=Salipiger pallidus TaxID=1775170 RepID=A0A8J2ZJV9_9RHOB|nr:hypothetical protein [Salipiger pallidus]GGG73118.1 hypothetical protein GCM10011415_21700 [Salipiger pallidus]
MKRGAELFFRGLMDELDPAMRELEDLAQDMEPALRSFREEMGPALRDMMGEVQDWSAYEAPEMLPNGDIIMRRRDDVARDDEGGPDLPEPYTEAPETDKPRVPFWRRDDSDENGDADENSPRSFEPQGPEYERPEIEL